MLPVRGKTRQHCWAPRGHKKCFWRFSETFFVSRTQNLCPPQMLRAWQNESTFRKHDHVSNVAATLCPRFAGPLYYSVSKSPLRCFFINWTGFLFVLRCVLIGCRSLPMPCMLSTPVTWTPLRTFWLRAQTAVSGCGTWPFRSTLRWWRGLRPTIWTALCCSTSECSKRNEISERPISHGGWWPGPGFPKPD